MRENNGIFRIAVPADAEQLLAIYAPFVTDTAITFEYEVPSLAEFEQRIRDFSADYPFLVYEENGEIGGYAYAHRMFSRAAYQWTAELSVYLAPRFQRRGLGSLLYTKLIALLKMQNVRNLYALVTSPHPASDRLHEQFGFVRAGVYHRSGYKCGKWHDVSLYERFLSDDDGVPQDFVPFSQLDTKIVSDCLKR